jgi:hypothetical protein
MEGFRPDVVTTSKSLRPNFNSVRVRDDGFNRLSAPSEVIERTKRPTKPATRITAIERPSGKAVESTALARCQQLDTDAGRFLKIFCELQSVYPVRGSFFSPRPPRRALPPETGSRLGAGLVWSWNTVLPLPRQSATVQHPDRIRLDTRLLGAGGGWSVY